MKRFLILAAVSALVIARPETYKEQEDFQYSRSSSDDGTKSGYYGAQRGNMGGNYERAHNMDALAQHQMSGLVRQVNGDLGDGAKTRAGSVYSAANSRGTYGSGAFDLSNLAGRNFQEGAFSDNSQLSSAQYSSSRNSAGYASSTSQNYGSNRKIASGAQIQTDNLQSLDNTQASNQHNYGSSRSSSGYQSQAGFQEHSQYNSDSANSGSGYGSTQYNRLTPVRIIVRPGGRVAIPVGAQVYDATQGSTFFNHNALSSGDELASEINQGSVNRPSNTKYYETSYRYNKKWEKHDTIPTGSGVAPSESPIPKNSELYEDLDVHRSDYQNNARRIDNQNAHSSSASGRYNAAQASSQSQYQSNYNSQQSSGASNSNAYTHSGHNSHLNRGVASDYTNTYAQALHNSGSRYNGVSADSSLNTQTRHNADSQLNLNDQVESLNSRPKSYQSSYSYHKSWERQGDPYVIKPASSGYYDSQSSQRLTSSTKNLGYTAYQPSSNYGNCDEKCHIRVARSHGTNNKDLEQQQSQSSMDNQHVQGTWTNLEDLSQQSQNNWGQANEQQAQNQWDHLQDLNQQSQNTWDQQNVGQQSQTNWDNLKDLTQQSQSNWDQQTVGQQSQTNWDNLKDLTQQSQTNWDQQSIGQQSQTTWDNLKDLTQQSQTNWDQQSVGQQSQNHWDNLEDLGQQSRRDWGQSNVGQQTQNQWDNLEDLGQQSRRDWGQSNVGQQSNNNWDKIEKLNLSSPSNWGTQNEGQHSLDQNKWDKLEDITQSDRKQDSEILGQQAQNNQDNKPHEDLYAKYDHKLEVIRPNIQLEHPQPSNEKENDRTAEIPFDNRNSKKSKVTSNQQNTDFRAIFEGFKNKSSVDKKITSYGDDVLIRQVLQSHKINFNNNDDFWPHQKDSNDNPDYGYSNGFVNPFFNENHKNQLANNDNPFAVNGPDFHSIWNTHIHSNSHYNSQSRTDLQQTSLSNLWSKFDKFDTGSGISYMNHPNTNQTNQNFTLLVNRDVESDNQPWYARDAIDTSKANTEINTALIKQENHEGEAHSTSIQTTQTHRESIDDKKSPKNIHTMLNIDKAETPQDIGRGDIGPGDSIINETNNPFNNPISTILISQNRDNPTKPENAKSVIDIAYTHIQQEVPEDQLTVLSLEQQRKDNKLVVPYNNDITPNIILQNDKEMTQILSLNEIKMGNQSLSDYQSKYFETQADSSTQNHTNTQNYSQQVVESQSTSNFNQESINLEQQNVYNFGQDLEFFTQQNENLEQHDLHNYHVTSHNVEQKNLHKFGQDKTKQVPHVGQENINIEQHIYDHGNMLHLGRQNNNINLLNETSFRQESMQEIEKANENLLQQYFKPEHNDTNKNTILAVNVHFLDNPTDNLNKSNLSRVQKSVRVSNLDNDDDHLIQNFGNIQSEKNYGADYEQEANSYEQEFDQDFNMQYQSHGRNLNKSELDSEKEQLNGQDIKTQTEKNSHTEDHSPVTSKINLHTQNADILHRTTQKPGFWQTVGNKFTSAKNTIASWFKS